MSGEPRLCGALLRASAEFRCLPIEPALTACLPQQLQHSLAEPEVYGVFTNANLLGTIAAVISKTPTVKVLIYDGAEKDVKKGALDTIKSAGVKVFTFDEFIQLGKDKPSAPNLPQPEDVACIMYTSGSTGAPKGVLLTNANIVATISGVETLLGELVTPDAKFLAFLPLAHIFEFAVEMTMLWVGVSPPSVPSPQVWCLTLFVHRSLWDTEPSSLSPPFLPFEPIFTPSFDRTLTDTSVRNCVGDIRAFKPTIMCGVPAVWELIRKGILSKVRAGGPVKEAIFNFACAAKKYMGAKSIVGRIMDAVVFKAVKEATGGQLHYGVNGGAALSKETQEFLSTCLVDVMIQGYGMPSSSSLPLGAVLTFWILRHDRVFRVGSSPKLRLSPTSTDLGPATRRLSFILPPSMIQTGVVGVPVPSAEAKLVDFAEANYFSTNDPPQGEIWIRGPSVSKGYCTFDCSLLLGVCFTLRCLHRQSSATSSRRKRLPRTDGCSLATLDKYESFSRTNRAELTHHVSSGTQTGLSLSLTARRTLSSCPEESTSRWSVSSTFNHFWPSGNS